MYIFWTDVPPEVNQETLEALSIYHDLKRLTSAHSTTLNAKWQPKKTQKLHADLMEIHHTLLRTYDPLSLTLGGTQVVCSDLTVKVEPGQRYLGVLGQNSPRSKYYCFFFVRSNTNGWCPVFTDLGSQKMPVVTGEHQKIREHGLIELTIWRGDRPQILHPLKR